MTGDATFLIFSFMDEDEEVEEAELNLFGDGIKFTFC